MTTSREVSLGWVLALSICAVCATAGRASAKPVTVACAKLAAVTFDDARWTRKQAEQEGSMCDLALDPTPADGTGLTLWGIELAGKDKDRVAKDTPAGLLQHMINMLSKGNQGFKVTSVTAHGPYHFAAGRHVGPNDKTYDTHIAVHRNDRGMYFVVWEFEPTRAPPKTTYDAAAAKARFLAWLDAVQPAKATP